LIIIFISKNNVSNQKSILNQDARLFLAPVVLLFPKVIQGLEHYEGNQQHRIAE
jgi:hypothetical protein